MSTENISFEELLKNIHNDKAIIEKEKIEISTELEKMSSLRKSLEKDNSNLEEKAKNLINDAKLQARNILLDAKDEANEIIKEMNNAKTPKNLNNLKAKLNDEIKKINIESSDIDTSKSLDEKDIKPNAHVFVSTFGEDGIVISNISKSNEVQVQIGNIKTNVNIKYLQKVKNNTNSNYVKSSNVENNSIHTNISSKSRNIKSEINVIGLNSEEAIFVVDKFLDDALLAKLQTIRIVHGKGTGKLKSVIHEYLKKHPNVKSFRLGTYGEGEMGVTIVELK